MSYTTKDMTGMLFVNGKKKSPKHPDREGYAAIGGVRYRIAGWIVRDEAGEPKKDRNGNQMMSIKLEAEDTERAVRDEVKRSFQADDLDDQIPF